MGVDRHAVGLLRQDFAAFDPPYPEERESRVMRTYALAKQKFEEQGKGRQDDLRPSDFICVEVVAWLVLRTPIQPSATGIAAGAIASLLCLCHRLLGMPWG